jgi:hypothetical protein
MAYATGTVTTGEQDALTAGRPLLCATNHVRNIRSGTTALEWSASGSWADSAPAGASNRTSSSYPTTRAWDGRLYADTRPTGAEGTEGSGLSERRVFYLLADLDESTLATHTIDLVMVRPLNVSSWPGVATVQVQIADDNAFTSNLLTIASFTGADLADRKLLDLNLTTGAGANLYGRFTSVRYARLRISTTVTWGSVRPQIGEWVMGRRRQLAHNPRVPHDERPASSAVADFVAQSQAVSRYVYARGARNIEAGLMPVASGAYSIDEVSTLRSWFSEADFGSRPFLYYEPAVTGQTRAGYWMMLEEPSLAMPLNGPFHRSVTLTMREQPPFATGES